MFGIKTCYRCCWKMQFSECVSQSTKYLLVTVGLCQYAVLQEKWLDGYEMGRMWKWF